MNEEEQTMDEEISNSHSAILRALECTICKTLMVPPIIQCLTGENICINCKFSPNHCPFIFGEEQKPHIRNVALENLAEKTIYPCVNKHRGCPDVFPMLGIRVHEEKCLFAHYQCPFAKIFEEDCDWQGTLSDIKAHVRESHNEVGEQIHIAGNYLMTLPNVTDKSVYRVAVFTLDELFFVFFKCMEDMFYSVAFYVGNKEEALKFRCNFSITSDNTDEAISQCLATHSFLENIDEIIESGDCMAIHWGNIVKFIRKKNLPFIIEILKVSSTKNSDAEESEVESDSN